MERAPLTSAWSWRSWPGEKGHDEVSAIRQTREMRTGSRNTTVRNGGWTLGLLGNLPPALVPVVVSRRADRALERMNADGGVLPTTDSSEWWGDGAALAEVPANKSDVASPRHTGIRQVQVKHSPSFQMEPLFDDEVRIEDLEKEKQRQLEEAKAARRRQRHKEVVARSRLKHKASAAAIQQQEALLGKRLHELLEQSGHAVMPVIVPLQECQGKEELHHKYAEQVAIQERIRLENNELRRRIDDHTKLCDAINKELVLSGIDADSSESDGAQDLQVTTPERPKSGSGSWIFFEDDDDPFYFVPLSENNCQEIMRTVFQRMLNLYAQFVQRSIRTSELEFFGWKVQRPLDVGPRVLRFQFTKTVRCVNDTMDSIINRTWTAFHDPKLFASIYSTPVVTRVIQRVTHDMTVLIQNAPVQSGRERNIRYFNILARVRGLNAQQERVVALLKTIVKPDDCYGAGEVIPQLHEIEWMKRGISYLLLKEEQPQGQSEGRMIRLHYGCDYECVSEDHARYLMVEVLGIACRWEQLIMPSHCLTF